MPPRLPWKAQSCLQDSQHTRGHTTMPARKYSDSVSSFFSSHCASENLTSGVELNLRAQGGTNSTCKPTLLPRRCLKHPFVSAMPHSLQYQPSSPGTARSRPTVRLYFARALSRRFLAAKLKGSGD